MPQLQMPIFQEGTQLITPDLGYCLEEGQITYVYGIVPVFSHREDDLNSFKMIVSQFHVNGHATQMQLVRAFGLNPLAVKRWGKKFRHQGAGGFYAPRGRKPTNAKKVSTKKKNRPLRPAPRVSAVKPMPRPPSELERPIRDCGCWPVWGD